MEKGKNNFIKKANQLLTNFMQWFQSYKQFLQQKFNEGVLPTPLEMLVSQSGKNEKYATFKIYINLLHKPVHSLTAIKVRGFFCLFVKNLARKI